MAISMFFFSGCMLDFSVKLSLLVCLGQEPHLRAHFTALATAHIVANAHGTYMHCRSASRLPRGATMLAMMLLFGLVTPLMQAVHILDMAAGWRMSQDLGRRPSVRLVPLDVVLEGLVFMCTAVHLRICLILGRIEAPHSAPLLPLRFEALLALTLTTSVVTTAAGLAIWDSTVSIELSRDLYGWPGHGGGGGLRGGGLFLAHLVFRGSEVAGKSALLALCAALLGAWHTAGYVVFSYCANLLVLLLVSHHEAYTWHFGEAAILAWPLIFANLPQFVDSPQHSAAARSVAGLVCGLRAMELAIAFSAALATLLLEAELETNLLGSAGLYAGVDVVQAMQEWIVLRRRNATPGLGFCLLVHYLWMASQWCRPCFPARTLEARSRPATRQADARRRVPPALDAGQRAGPALTWLRSAEGDEREDFWCPAAGLAPLLLASGCKRAPVACWLMSAAPSPSIFSGAHAAERQVQLEDFEMLRLIGFGEFGKVFEVRQRSTWQVYAMKRLSKEFYLQRKMTDKAIREIYMLSLARNHPFVVQLMYTIETSSEWVMIMEHCPNGNLQQLLLAEGCPGLALSRTSRISAEVALALELLHTNSIVFRDLKLENVVLDRDGHAKLTDFGLAKQHRGGQNAIAEAELAGGVYASFAKTFCGSYGYAAPEVNQLQEGHVHGFAADLYSFGVLLLMLLSGGEVFRNAREPGSERRLPPERPRDLRGIVGQLSFDFYWTSHHLLQPARSAHQVEINLDGAVVIESTGPRGVRRQTRPQRPPSSPRFQGLNPEGAAHANHPMHFPTLACCSSETARRRWDLALDLVRVLTNELPEQRGTVATLKQHHFFSEEIQDWRSVYPKSWLIDRLKDKLLAVSRAGSTRDVLPSRIVQFLEGLPVEELLSLQDDPEATAELIRQMSLESSRPPDLRSPPASAIPHSEATAAPSASRRHTWCAHYVP